MPEAPQDVTGLIEEVKYFHTVTPETENCLEITFIAREASDEVLDAIDERKAIDESIIKAVTISSDTTEYPILVVAANYKGQYGNDYAFRFFANQSDNNA